MTKLLHFLRAAWMFATSKPSGATAVAWTPDDAAALTHFLASAAGQKLARRIHDTCNAINAGSTQKGTPWACGFACGYRALAADIGAMTLPAASPDTGEHEADELGGVDLETYCP